MTDTTTGAAPTGSLEHLNPNDLDIDPHVRDHPDIDRDFLASIKEHGVLQPILAVRAPDGQIRVRAGQRRTLAARQANLATVPVYITTDNTNPDKARDAARIAEQIVENDHRAALTESQRAKGIQQLLLHGVTPTKVAKALSIRKEVVEAAATIAESAPALEALDTTQLTIEQAASLAEFNNDPDSLHYLQTAANPGEFDHRLSELRQQARSAAERAAAAEPLRQQGYTILDQRPSYYDSLARSSLVRLFTPQGEPADQDESITSARPELWAVWLEEATTYIDTRTGEAVDEYDVDWDIAANDTDTEAEEGYIHPRYVQETSGFKQTFYCLDPAAAGLITSEDHYGQRGSARGGGIETAEQAEARKDAERRERRKVVVLNKLGQAAAEVRQAWVKDTLLSRKTPPKGAAMFIARQLCEHPHLITAHSTKETTRALLGLAEGHTISAAVSALPPTGDPRATVITLGLVLAAMEAETPKDAWRRSYSTYSKDYLTFLAANGYQLSDVEKVITGKLKADTLYDKIAAADQKRKTAA